MNSPDEARSAAQPALVSIGVPVFNEQANLEKAVGDLLAQTHTNLELIISDNASDDDTEAIARRLARSDSRVRYVRQPINRGPVDNFRFVLREASGEFFMWAAADDRWEPNFVEKNLERLMSEPGTVASVSRVSWSVDGSPAGMAFGTGALVGTARRRVNRYLRYARDNSRFYGIFRREAIEASFPPDDFYAADLAATVGTLLLGDHAEVSEPLMTRNRNDPMSYISMVDATNSTWLSRWLPLLPFTRYVVRRLRIPLSATTILFLAARNAYEHFRYAAQRQTPYGALARLVVKASSPIRARAVGERR